MDRYRVFTINDKRFPDMKKMAWDLEKDGFKLVAAVDPGIAAKDDYPLYGEGREKGFFCKDEKGGEFNAKVWPGKVAFPDFSKPEVCEWWGDLHKMLLDAGIEGIWNDMNEPSCWTLDIRGFNAVLALRPVRKPKMVHDDQGRNTPHLSFRNLYGLKEVEGTYEGLLRHRPGIRPFILTRSGYAGIQKWAAVWTGDNSSTFPHLALTIPMLLNLGLSGVPFVGPDIGGFMWNCTPELYARWIQLGAFYPFCRTHCAIKMRRQEPWTFGERVERIARDYLKLRYRLFPTLYSLFRESHETGAPILRPLFYEFQEERACSEIEDQLMFGPGLLLAPVLKKRQTRREVYLPAATWTDYWTGERIKGPKVVSRDAPLELMPLYVKDGTALFMWPAMSWLDERPAERLFLDLYPPGKGACEAALYEDDGISLDYEKGVFSKRRVVQERASSGLAVRIAAREGRFEPPARDLVLKVFLEARPGSVELDGKKLSIGGRLDCEYIISERVLRLAMPDDGGAHELVIES
jgi:alpha-glucosidase